MLDFKSFFILIVLSSLNLLYGLPSYDYGDDANDLGGISDYDLRASGFLTEPEYPWQVYIKTILGNIVITCGGTLIHERFVLTAAHCVEYIKNVKEEIEVTLGEYNINAIEGTEVRPKVRRVIIHPEYSRQKIFDIGHGHDIALIEFLKPVDIFTSYYIEPAYLPTSEPSIGPAFVVGWGYTDKNVSPDELVGANLKIISNEDCSHIRKQLVAETIICTLSGVDNGNPDNLHGVCSGDSGGNFITIHASFRITYWDFCFKKGGLFQVDQDGYLRVVGVVSFGSMHMNHTVEYHNFMCNKSKPQFFTNINYFMPWINRYLHAWMKTEKENEIDVGVLWIVENTFEYWFDMFDISFLQLSVTMSTRD